MNQFEIMKETDRTKWWGRLEIDPRFYKEGQPIIDWFFDEYRFLSNYHVLTIEWNGKKYMSTEHAYQSAKAITEDLHEKVRLAESCGKAKKLGGQIEIRTDWESVKEGIMREVVALKFKDPELAKKLLATGDAYIIEGTTWHDNTWGICVKKGCEKCKDKVGKNLLGKILMEIRQKIKG